LAFIGYFCVEAGVALCIGTIITKPTDWAALFDARRLVLAFPGIASGVVLTLVARKCDNEAMLPLSMVVIPTIFYAVLLLSGLSIDDAREGGWVGQTSPPIPVRDLIHLVDFGLVRWGMAKQLLSTWAGEYARAGGLKSIISFSSFTSRLIQVPLLFFHTVQEWYLWFRFPHAWMLRLYQWTWAKRWTPTAS
jgi:hypothetical protein